MCYYNSLQGVNYPGKNPKKSEKIPKNPRKSQKIPNPVRTSNKSFTPRFFNDHWYTDKIKSLSQGSLNFPHNPLDCFYSRKNLEGDNLANKDH